MKQPEQAFLAKARHGRRGLSPIFAAVVAAGLAGCTAQAEGPSARAEVSSAQPLKIEDGMLTPWLVEEGGVDALYRVGLVDLDDDGFDEALVYLGGPGRCGSGGCNLYVLRSTVSGFVTIGRTSVGKLPVGVLETRHNGLRDIVMRVGGGGLSNPGFRALHFDGESYPINPTVAPAEVVEEIGTMVISEGDMRPIVY